MSQLRKEAQAAPKFILAVFDTDRYVFIHKDCTLFNIKITDKISDAMHFSYGFDDENIRAKAWSISTGLEFIDIKA